MQNDSQLGTSRQKWMAVLAKAYWSDLEPLWQSIPVNSKCDLLRKPETGLVMVRGRMGGSGQPFNTGEATVTRCSVENSSGLKGHAYVIGRNKRHALAAAEIDAGLQDENTHETLMEQIIQPLERLASKRHEKHRRKVAATKVDFFTLVRGEDE